MTTKRTRFDFKSDLPKYTLIPISVYFTFIHLFDLRVSQTSIPSFAEYLGLVEPQL
jgi:hypothetical protein